ncbi:MAG: UbiA family prenyltransferase [Acidobacteria bacterium]|nr:UbiA family prenyltransferase [Acidobacteriota bacterium]MBS1865713.1 UbiA family prenyltransferase [Acidobacteriota bacterium]
MLNSDEMNVAAQAHSQPLAKFNSLSNLKFLLQVSRPGLWATTILFYLMPLGRSFNLRTPSFWLGLFYIVFPLSLLLYGVNDIVDAEGDRLNPRKGTYLFGSRGADQHRYLRWQIAAWQIPFFCFFWMLTGWRITLWFAAILLAVYVYNVHPFALKGRPPFDVLIQSSYLLIFILSSWINNVPQLPWQTFVFGGLFAMHSHVFGEIMDIEPDQQSGRATLATKIGRIPAKLFVATLLLIEIFLVLRYFRDPVIAFFLAAGAFFFLLDATLLWQSRPYSPSQMRLFLWGWNIAAALGVLWNAFHGSLLIAHARPLPS